MPTNDMFGNRCDLLLRIHVRRISDVAYDVMQAIRYAQHVYGKCGVAVELASSQSVSLPIETSRELSRLALTCKDDSVAGVQDELYGWFGVQDFGSVTAFIVRTLNSLVFNEDVRGCAAHAAHRPAVYLSSLANENTLAHELGHVLLTPAFRPKHMRQQSNVMVHGELRKTSSSSPSFDEYQVMQMRRNPLLLPC